MTVLERSKLEKLHEACESTLLEKNAAENRYRTIKHEFMTELANHVKKAAEAELAKRGEHD